MANSVWINGKKVIQKFLPGNLKFLCENAWKNQNILTQIHDPPDFKTDWCRCINETILIYRPWLWNDTWQFKHWHLPAI